MTGDVCGSLQLDVGDDVFTDEVEVDGGPDSVSPRPSLASDRRDYMSLAAVPRLSRPSVEIKVPPAHPVKSLALPSVCWAVWALLWWWWGATLNKAFI